MTKPKGFMSKMTSRVKRLFRRENLPRSRWARIAIGVVLVLCGFVGFLPILGFWMVPMGLAILAIDIPIVRRLTQKVTVAVTRWWSTFRGRHGKRAGTRAHRPSRSAIP